MLQRSRKLAAIVHQPLRWTRPVARRSACAEWNPTRASPCRRYTAATGPDSILERFKEASRLPPATCSFAQLAKDGEEWTNRPVVLHGYLGTRRVANKNLLFAELQDSDLAHSIQLVSTPTPALEGSNDSHSQLQQLEDHTPVVIAGTVKSRKAPKTAASPSGEKGILVSGVEIKVEQVTALNGFPKDVVMKPDTVFPAEQRHLQIRNQKGLRHALRFRSEVAQFLRNHLVQLHGFEEIETPLLFKSTPEGAREFLVPTRAPGLAYALPQSPQQYKQILMASGVSRYVQLAKCFRDEDLRADRQPEFTQLDLEMAFADGELVMQTVETMIKALWSAMLSEHAIPDRFPRLSYNEAMSQYGSDKPDTRFGSRIVRVDHLLPVDLVSKLGPLTSPIVEAIKIPVSTDAKETQGFVKAFMDSTEAWAFNQNPDGQPGMFIYDPRKPLQGMQAFGFEAAEQLEETLDLEEGDLIVLQARKNEPMSGGSTPLGNLRLALHRACMKAGLQDAPTGYSFLWVQDFPLFSPTEEDGTGQGGSTGISSTHHPFTAPKTDADVDLLLTDPLQARADHYDLVVNGVELGGGSRRIHVAAMQDLVMRQVLGMDDARMQDFAHLIEVLRSGCPPHAGMALGFDRLIAVMLGRESVRDVIAFPKSGRGEDLLVKSPTRMTADQLATYHLRLKGDETI